MPLHTSRRDCEASGLLMYHSYYTLPFGCAPHSHRVITTCLPVNSILAPETTTIVYVSSITIAGPFTASQTANFRAQKTSVVHSTYHRTSGGGTFGLFKIGLRNWSRSSKPNSSDSTAVRVAFPLWCIMFLVSPYRNGIFYKRTSVRIRYLRHRHSSYSRASGRGFVINTFLVHAGTLLVAHMRAHSYMVHKINQREQRA